MITPADRAKASSPVRPAVVMEGRMRCQVCNDNKATIHLTEIEKGEQKELHLCEACAIKKGYVQKNSITLKEFLGKIAEQSQEGTEKNEPQIKCPNCGGSFQDFSSLGRLGCPEDYSVFAEHLGELIEKIHGGARQHTGKIPSQAGSKVAIEKEIRQMRLELESLVQQENYEKAAAIRDRIRVLENRDES